jgi:hypothetical protein
MENCSNSGSLSSQLEKKMMFFCWPDWRFVWFLPLLSVLACNLVRSYGFFTPININPCHLTLLDAGNFDAGQYAFFGKEPLEGLELSCLEDGGGDGNGGGFSGPEDGLYRLSSVGEEVRIPEPSFDHVHSCHASCELSSS